MSDRIINFLKKLRYLFFAFVLIFKTQSSFASQTNDRIGQLYHQFQEEEQVGERKELLKELLENTNKVKNDSIFFEVNLIAARFYLENVNYDSAILFLNRAELRIESTDKESYARLWNLYGDCYFDKSDLIKAQEYYQKVIDFTPDSELLQSMILTTYLNLSDMYSKWDYEDKAIRYLQEAVTQNTFDSDHMKSRHVFHSLGLIFLNTKVYDSALTYFTKAIDGLDRDNFSHLYGIYYNNAGICLQNLGELNRADETYQKGLDIRRARGNKSRIASTLTNIATNALLMGELKQALNYALECIQLAKEVGNPDLLSKGYSLGKEAYEKLAMYEEAYALQALEIPLQDSLFDISMHNQLTELETKYESEKKDLEIDNKNIQIEQESKIRTYLIIGLLLMMVIVATIVWSNRLLKSKSREIAEKNRIIKEEEKLKSRWFVNVSHDLKTPLTLIQGPIQKILKEETIKEGGKEDLRIADRNVKQLSRLISQIMDVSKLEHDKLKPNLQAAHLQNLMRETVALFESFAAINQVNLSLQLAGSNYLKVDEDLIRKVIINLISNALKYTHQGGEVTVSLIGMSDRFAISVNDDGEGISEEDLPFIFDRYYQSNNSEKALQGGTGVGLSLSKEIVEMHEGELSVESLEGRGSTFTFTIPRSFETEGESLETDIEGSSKIQIIEPIVEDTNKPLLLLVEDNADMRLYIKNIMKADYRVHEARDGIEALEMLSAALPAVIISDIMMPRMDGIKLAKEIKKHSDWKSIPFVSLTSLSGQGHKTFTLQIGIDDYICKPFDPEELKIRISNLIENHNNRKSLEKEESVISYNDAVIKKLQELVQKNMTSSLLSIGFLASELNMSERKLQRDLKKSTGLTPVQFIREIRLQKALELLENQVYPTLSEVVHAIGFERTSYFTELFKKRFGKNPGGYLK